MSKAGILNLLLLVIVVALGGLIVFSEQPDNRLQRLTTIDANTIRNITIRHNTNHTMIRKSGPDGWSITEPITIAANNFRISSLLKLLNAPVHARYPAGDIDLASVGLATVDLDASTTSVDFDEREITFGITNPATELRYVLMDGTVYTIEDVFFPLISSHFGTLVSFSLLPDSAIIDKIVLPGQTIDKDDKGRWHSDIDSSADQIVAIVDHWKTIQAFGVHEYLQREDHGTATIYLKDSMEPIIFHITDIDPWLVLARPELGIEYHLDKQFYQQLIDPESS